MLSLTENNLIEMAANPKGLDENDYFQNSCNRKEKYIVCEKYSMIIS